jgi:hypothetical protein
MAGDGGTGQAMSSDHERDELPEPPGTEVPPSAPSRSGESREADEAGSLDLDALNSAIAPDELSGPAKPDDE